MSTKEVPLMSSKMVIETANEVHNVTDFVFGGNSEFTIANMNTGEGCKYKVRQCKDNKNLFFVRVKDGSEWEYAGFITRKDEGMYYKKGNKGTRDFEDPDIKGLTWALVKGRNSELPNPIIMMHHGRCACCGKKLDDAISVSRGFGPVCWDRLQAYKAKKEGWEDASKEDIPFD